MSLITSVALQRTFVSLASDPSVTVICGTAGSIGGGGQRDDNITLEGEYRNYANFVTRLITGTAKTRAQTVVLRALTPAQVKLIESWIGQTVLFRDTYGRRVFGSYIVIDETDIPLSGAPNQTLLTDVGLVIQTVNYTEGV